MHHPTRLARATVTIAAGAVMSACAAASGRSAPTTAMDATCALPSAAIASLSVATGDSVVTAGTVVGDYEGAAGLRGFYLQGARAALFVANGDRDDVRVGDRVRVAGRLATSRLATSGARRLEASAITVCGTGSVAPSDIMLPLADSADLARFEGMLVRFPQRLYVAEHFQLGRYGELTLASGGVPVTPTDVAPPGAAARERGTANERNRILLDDALTAQNPETVFGRDGAPLSADNTLRVGDAVTGLVGVLTRTAAGTTGAATWRVRPTDAAARIAFTAANARRATPPAVGGTTRIASFNVLNYFNAFGQGCRFGCRGADDATEIDRQARKLVAAITALDADVVGVIEIGNDGYGAGSSIADLTSRLNAATSPGRYAFIDADSATGQTNALGTDAIKVGMLYQRARVTPTGRTAVLNTPAFVNAGDSAERNRPSLVQAFTATAGGRVVVSINHFKSKGSACDAPDANDGQGNCSAVRTRAANTLLDWLASDPTGTGESRVLVMGDLNSYAMEDPVRVFRERGFTDLLARQGNTDGYSYVFGGARGRLDHALASSALASQTTGSVIWHINADEPPVLDYNTNFKSPAQRESLYRADAFRSSDHDPVLVGVRLGGVR